MTGARRPYRLLVVLAWVLVATTGLALAIYAVVSSRRLRAAAPLLDGKQGGVADVLGFPWSDFPSLPDAERQELAKLVPIDPPLRLADVRPWLSNPREGYLGGGEARANAELQAALRILRDVADRREEAAAGETPGDRAEAAIRESLAQAKEHLGAAELSSSQSLQWLISYDRGVLYLWLGNRQKAAKEFGDAAKRLQRRLEVTSSPEILAAGVHVHYALGDALAEAPAAEAGKPAAAMPEEVVTSLREAVLLSVRLFGTSRPQGVAHAAEFFEIEPTRLPTRALRNDLIATYLASPNYRLCGEAMTSQTCAQARTSSGPCAYRSNVFCNTLDKVSNRLRNTYRRQLDLFIAGGATDATEARLWALQSVAELEAENALDHDLEVSYNVAQVLLAFKQPTLAYAYLQPAVTNNPNVVIPQVARLAFFTSILAGAPPAAMAEEQAAEDLPVSDYRDAYNQLYKAQNEPEPFRPLQIGDEPKSRRLDAWLFIRRYRHLLAGGNFEAFVAEHRQMMGSGAPKDFLLTWKDAVVAELLQRIAKVRKGAQPQEAVLIDAFVGRRDLFTAAEVKAAGLAAPFWSPQRRLALAVIGLLILWLALAAALRWLTVAYRWTFLSAYRRDREEAAQP